jgi:hypothetical protein
MSERETWTKLNYGPGPSWKKVSIRTVKAIAAEARAASIVLVPLSEQQVLTAIEQNEGECERRSFVLI